MKTPLIIQALASLIKFIAWELIIVLLLIFTLTHYFIDEEKTIRADGLGYYDYLPSIFIYHDFVRLNTNTNTHPDLYHRIEKTGVYIDYYNTKVNKYPCGTALLLSPFYGLTSLLSNKNDIDGYTIPFHKAVHYAAVFYLFLTLLFLKKLLLLYNIEKINIILTQLFLVFSTSILHYTKQEASFSHVYSLFAITTFIYFSKAYFLTYRNRYFYWACIFIALILILRQINIIIIFIIPFLAGSSENFKRGIATVLNRTSMLLKGSFIFLCIISIQCLAWYLQTSYLFVYSYQNESFDFFNPEIINILFSYKKGLFVYAPILAVAMIALVKLFLSKRHYEAVSWLLFFSVCTYVLSSWWSWYYGCSYGLRAYIDFYSVFFILFALLLNQMRLLIKIPLLILCALTIPLNLIQTFQYQGYILHWMNMDQEKYWKVFLKTEDKYKGLVWKASYDYSKYDTLDVIHLNNVSLIPYQEKTLLYISADSIKNQQLCTTIQLSFSNTFDKENNARFTLDINNDEDIKNYYYHTPPLIHFAEDKFGTYHKGFYNFELHGLTPNRTINLIVSNQANTLYLKDLQLVFLKPKL